MSVPEWRVANLPRPGSNLHDQRIARERNDKSMCALKSAICHLLPLIGAICWTITLSAQPSGETPVSGAMNTIFGENVLQQDVIAIRKIASSMPPPERYEFLSQWVLPNAGRSAIRMSIDFSPPQVATVDRSVTDHRWDFSHQLVAPAIDLVETARELGRIEELRTAADNCNPQTPEQQKQQAAFLAILSIAAGDFDESNASLQRVFKLAQSIPIVTTERGPEAIAAWMASKHLETQESARDLVNLVYEQARNKQGPRSERWHRHTYSLKHHLEASVDPADGKHGVAGSELPVQQPRTNWLPVSRMTEGTHGLGYPTASWQIQRGDVRHVTGHDDDYLYYAIPLNGNFAVEADTSTFNYKDIHTSFGGYWAGPGYDLKACLVGNFRQGNPSSRIDPPLSPPGESMRVRLIVRDGVRTTYINGREVYQRPHPVASDPWLAIHSAWYCNGSVQNLFVSGAPTIPEVISLATTPDLPGWLPYFDSVPGRRDSDWRLDVQPDKEAESDSALLIGRRRADLAGSFTESLLRYHRPMMEDGTIDYEFFWKNDAVEVHPALDRLCFVLQPTGAKTHWVTDGRFDGTGLDPANVDDGGEKEKPLPLNENAWNRLQLKLTGDVVDLSLNGQHVFSHKLEAGNVRSFGLFHYADQTEARVRNIEWRGDWPQVLPPVDQQELSNDPSLPIIAAVKNLPLVFDHDFAKGLPQNLFSVYDGGLGTDIAERPDGVHVTRPGGEGYLKYGLGPRLRVDGNFEITADFENLETHPSDDGNCNCHLVVELPNQACRLYRRGEKSKQGLMSSVFRRLEGRTQYLFPVTTAEDAKSGRLRIARIVDQLHYLFAEHDSEFFRLVDTQEIGVETTISDGIRLVQETQNPGSGSVVWKRLTIRAETVSEDSIIVPAVTVDELDRQRGALIFHLDHDFTTQAPTVRLFAPMGTTKLRPAEPQGFQVIASGSEMWTSNGLAAQTPLTGDFDVTLDLTPEKLDVPRAGDDTAMILQTEFRDKKRTAVELKLSVNREGNREMQIMRRIDGGNGDFAFQTVSTAPVKTVRSLRIARRDSFAHLLYREQSDSPWKLLGGVPVGTDDVPPTFLRMHVHTGGAKRESIVWFQRLSIAMDQAAAKDAP